MEEEELEQYDDELEEEPIPVPRPSVQRGRPPKTSAPPAIVVKPDFRAGPKRAVVRRSNFEPPQEEEEEQPGETEQEKQKYIEVPRVISMNEMMNEVYGDLQRIKQALLLILSKLK